MRKVIPFLKDEYFYDYAQKKIFKSIVDFITEYNNSPTVEALTITLQQDKTLTEDEFVKISETINEFSVSEDTNIEWLTNETEKFCKDRAVYNAIFQSIRIIEGKDTTYTPDAVPIILQTALGVCFDNSVGHDYLEDGESRYDFYHKIEEKISFDLDIFNKITKGGVSKKTLNIALAGTGVGKSLFMCHAAASILAQNKNVLYITMEMAEERIAERIDANLMNLTMDDLKTIPKKMFDNRLSKIKDKTQGKLIIKEYPTASAHAGHFRALLNDLKLKSQFIPDIIFIDYLNICASSRYKISGNVNTYTYIKGIAEELRGLAIEFNVPVFSATQTNRTGFSNSDVELTDTSESFGLPQTADFMFALISTEELENLGQLLVKQLKNRYADPNFFKRFVIGVDKSKMRLFDLDIISQKSLMQSEQKYIQKPEMPTSITSKSFSKNFDDIKF